ncbi:ESX secretion-associated protein EspG [Nocardia alni]|uniref:ESX secretion-associated protein EspG n=1 Tax=Nocardia alni TaxID=2815723 RepID=UPI0020B1D4D9|nr:ESX secretion-associated protein EspG [Nocardia alni]
MLKWVLTPDEFAHVWATETGLDYRPYPINAMIPVVPDLPAAGADHESSGVRQHYVRNTDPDLTAALLLCARPDATALTVAGERGATAERIIAFAAVAQQHAAILVARRESVVVLICHSQAVGRQLVQVIGSAPAGRNATMREATDAVLDPDHILGPDLYDARLLDPELLDPVVRFQRTLRAPVDSRGIVTVTTAPNDSSSPPTRHRTWLDVAGDGRYLLTTAGQLTLTPVDDEAFATQLLRLSGLL